MDPYSLSGNVFDDNHKGKVRFIDFGLLTSSLFTKVARKCPNF